MQAIDYILLQRVSISRTFTKFWRRGCEGSRDTFQYSTISRCAKWAASAWWEYPWGGWQEFYTWSKDDIGMTLNLITLRPVLNPYIRCTSGRSETMGLTSEMRIGIGSRRSVRNQTIKFLPLCSIISAEGNPDEEKIGAFGVGEWFLLSMLLSINLYFCTGFYSLFSVTEEPFVTSGGR